MVRPRKIVVGTRSSGLAMRQTEEFIAPLRRLNPDIEFVISTIKTRGDKLSEAPLLSIGTGVFVKEIEDTLLRGDIDMAVHSLKDLLTELPLGLALGAIGKRQDPRDILVNRWALPLKELPPNSRIGTSSPRRVALLKAARQDLMVLPIRGNIDTRIRKASGDDYDGVVLAAAGMIRMGRQDEIAQYLPSEEFVPAVGQGALAIEIRDDDRDILGLVSEVDHLPTRVAVTAERAFLAALGGGCAVPVAAYGNVHGQELRLVAMAGTEDGRQVFRAELNADTSSPARGGERLAQKLLNAGAREIVATAAH